MSNTMFPSVHKIGVGTIWCGRTWPPNNKSYVDPEQTEIDQYLGDAFGLVPEDKIVMLDTATGYGFSEERIGSWLAKNPASQKRALIATKFGERFDTTTGATTVDLSAAEATKCLAKSQTLLGRVDIFYSHITSQVNAEKACAVLADAELTATLKKMRSDGEVKFLGASISHKEALLEGLKKENGWFDHLDCLQLPTPLCLDNPSLMADLKKQGKIVIVNSPIRKIQASKTPKEMYKTVFDDTTISCCLTGTRTHLAETMGYLA
eukprot:m.127569 g.127569  ORF g.127569 m.127569 type:complete len:264 (-) comp29283_c0_seq2:68-859(-)